MPSLLIIKALRYYNYFLVWESSYSQSRDLVLLASQLDPFYPDNHWVPFTLTHLIHVTLTDTWSMLPWQTPGPCHPDIYLVHVTLTYTWSMLTWQTLGPCYPDIYLVHVTLTYTWSMLPWQTLGPCSPDRHLSPYIPIVPLTWQSSCHSPFYPNGHIFLLPWQPHRSF